MRSTAVLSTLAMAALAFPACSGDVAEVRTAAGSSSSGSTSSSASGSGGSGGGSVCGAGGSGGKAVCGNCVLDPGEACDDGNKIDGDACESDCSLPKCGNGIVDRGEVCWGGPLTNYPLQTSPEKLLVMDCDGDGDSDVLSLGTMVVGQLVWRIEALRNDGAGVLGSSVVTPVRPYATQIASGEFNGAPGSDLVVASGNEGSPTGTLWILGGRTAVPTTWSMRRLRSPKFRPTSPCSGSMKTSSMI